MNNSYFDSLASDDSDPFGSDSQDEYVPDGNEIDSEDEYNSDDSDEIFIDQATREEIAVEPNVSLLSKDRQIEYSKNPLAFGRSASRSSTLFRNRQGTKFFLSLSLSFSFMCIYFCQLYNYRANSLRCISMHLYTFCIPFIHRTNRRDYNSNDKFVWRSPLQR